MELFKAEELNQIAAKIKKQRDEERSALIKKKLLPIMERMKYAADLGDFYYDFSWEDSDTIEYVIEELQKLGYRVRIESRDIDKYMVRVIW